MTASDYHDVIQKVYIAYFGRAADPGGLEFYANLLAAGNAPATSEGFVAASGTNAAVKDMLAGFAASAESKAFYSSPDLSEHVKQIYLNVLGRTAEQGGVDYWVAQVGSGELSLSRAAFVILQAAEKHVTGDGLTVANKAQAAALITASLDLPGEQRAYATPAGLKAVQDLLADVTASAPLTQPQADAAILTLGAGGPLPVLPPAPAPAPSAPAAPATSTTLDALVPTVTGTAGSDTYTGTNTTFSATHAIDGLGATDTLNLTLSGAILAGTTSNVEVINITNLAGAQAVDASKFTGATQLNADRGTGATTFNNLASGQQAGMVGNGVVLNGNSIFNYGITVPSATVAISGGTRAGTITLTGTGISAATINSTGAANTVGAIALPATTTGLTINASSDLTTGNISGFTSTASTITVSGAASSVSIGTLDAKVATFNASGLTAGGVTAVMGASSSALVATVTGGAGNDTITTGAATFTGSVNAAGGTGDTLVVANTLHMTAGLGARYTNFETVQAGTGVTVNMDHLSGITGIKLNGNATFQNLTETQAGAITLLASSTPTLSLKTNTGADKAVIEANDGLVTTGTLTLTAPVLTGFEQLVLNATDNLTVTTLASSTALTSVQLKGAGSINLTTGVMPSLTSIDGSQATGNLTLSATTMTVGLTMTGGSGFDSLSGTTKADTFTGGAGQNRFIFATKSTGTPSATNFDTITDFRAGTGNIIDHGTAITVSSSGNGIAGQAFISASGVAGFHAADDTLQEQITAVAFTAATAGRAAIWQNGSDAYLFIAGDVNTTASALDVVVKLTGVTVGAGGLIVSGGDIVGIDTSTPAPSPAPAPAAGIALDAGVPTVTGTAGSDTYTGTNTTFSATHAIDGLGATDTLNLTLSGAILAGTTSNVEVINITNLAGAQAVDASKFTGATQLNADRGTGATTFNNLASGQQAGMVGNGVVLNGNSIFNYGITVPSATVAISGGTRAGTITLTGTGISAATINSTGAANTVGAIALPATTTGLTINASSDLTTGNISGFTSTASTITVSGAASSVSIGTLDAKVATFNASGLTAGGVTAVMGASSSALVATVTGGAGNDTITTGAATFTGSVNAAGGTGDTLVVANTLHMTAGLGARYTNFETVQAGTGVTVNMDHLSGITGIKLNGNATFQNLTETQAGAITLLASSTPTLSLKTNTGADKAVIEANDGLVTTGTLTLTAPVLTGFEQLVLNATDNLTVTTLASSTALTSVQLKGAGSINLTTGVMPSLTSIDGSQATGNLTLSATTMTVGLTMTGGSGFDSLSGTTKADTFTGGAGQNRFIFATNSTGTPSATNFDTITDFRAGTGNIIDHGTAITVSSSGNGIAGQAFIGLGGVASFHAADDTLQEQITAVAFTAATAGRAAIWQNGSDAYLFIAGDANTTATTLDLVVKLTGVTVGAGGLVLNATSDIVGIG